MKTPILKYSKRRVPVALAAIALAATLAGCDNNNNDNNDNKTSTAPTVEGTPTMPADVIGYYTATAQTDLARTTPEIPWWCAGANGDPDLSSDDCLDLSKKLDNAEYEARRYPTVADIEAAGGELVTDRPDNIGLAYTIGKMPTEFAENNPNVYLYGGPTNGNRLVGVAWATVSGGEPDGFAGERENWVADGSGRQWLMAWIIRGHENQPDVFATTQPCLTNTDTTLTSTTDDCFVAAHPVPFEVLVTNDDGYRAEGIDALVEGLYGLPNTQVHVVAPFANQSGSGDKQTRPGYVLTPIEDTTLSGKPATALSSDDPERPNGSGSPADTVVYGLNTMMLTPEVVMSGMNLGQNMGPATRLSGTVGAARTARRAGVPAIATSSGGLVPPNDFPTATEATLALLERWRIGQEINTVDSVLNINIPTCAEGLAPRGTVYTVVAYDVTGRDYQKQDCASTVTTFEDDVDAFNEGYIGITDAGRDQPPNWPAE